MADLTASDCFGSPTKARRPRTDRRHRVLVGVELATGASALVCGGLLAVRPDGSPLGLPARVLDGTPFTDWQLPGVLLAALVGVGYLAAGTSQRWRLPRSREMSVLAGSGLILFEAVEWAWLGFHPLRAVFMGVGAAVAMMAVSIPGTIDEATTSEHAS
ncbi:MAG: hypothetical protein ABIQ92_04545 [Ornithinibacter sp.]